MESKTSFASKYKTQIDDARMFCDFYNPKEDTYCKRLQVLCPEHNPDPRFLDDEVLTISNKDLVSLKVLLISRNKFLYM